MASEEPTEPAEKPRQRGTVKWFSPNKGFGFITPEGGGEDLFVHQSVIEAEGFRSLAEGEEVEFVVEPGDQGRFKAVQVSGPGRKPPKGAPRKPQQQHQQQYGFPPPPMFPGYGMPMAPYRGRGRGQPADLAGRMAPFPYAYPGYGYGFYPPAYPLQMPGYTPAQAAAAAAAAAHGGAPGSLHPRPPPGTPGVSSGYQVVVHNLPWNTTWQQLRDAFADTGDIQRADVIIDSAGRSRGFGTVRYATKEEAERAAEKMNNTKIGNRTISVRIDRFA